jgi:preprotein translocase subunit YajC
MLNTLVLFAQAAEEEVKKGQPDGIGGLFSNPIMPILVVMVLFFFLIILPAQRRQRKEQNAVMSSLKKNDEVVTTAGIIGIVAHIKESGDEVTLKIDDNARIRVLKSTIVRILRKDEPAKEATASAANTSIKPTT